PPTCPLVVASLLLSTEPSTPPCRLVCISPLLPVTTTPILATTLPPLPRRPSPLVHPPSTIPAHTSPTTASASTSLLPVSTSSPPGLVPTTPSTPSLVLPWLRLTLLVFWPTSFLSLPTRTLSSLPTSL